PCFYGIDFATRAELIANGLDTEGVRRSLGADSLGYVSTSGLVAATEQPANRLCTACFDGEYPIPLPPGELIGKHVLEGLGKRQRATDAAKASDDEQQPTTAAVTTSTGAGYGADAAKMYGPAEGPSHA